MGIIKETKESTQVFIRRNTISRKKKFRHSNNDEECHERLKDYKIKLICTYFAQKFQSVYKSKEQPKIFD